MKPDPLTLGKTIIACILYLAEEGELDDVEQDPDLGYTCEAVFGFSPDEVVAVHKHKIGWGDGIWFRLRDGRVVSAYREVEHETDPRLYDTIAN